jgi:hypothetical protein
MNALRMTGRQTLRGLALGVMSCVVLSATPVSAQQGGIHVVAPTLPPRQAGAGLPGSPSSPQTGQQISQPGYPQQQNPQQAYPQQYQQPQNPQSQYSAARGVQGGSRSPGAPGSALANRGGTGYPAQGGYGAYPQPAPSEPAAAIVAPTRSAVAGNCRVEPAPDRQSVSLLGPDALPRLHVPLGEFRVQQVIHSPDGRWAVAFTKLRGQPQFALITLDLARCEPQNTIDLPSAGDDARFEGDDAIVTLAGGERRVRLASTRVR